MNNFSKRKNKQNTSNYPPTIKFQNEINAQINNICSFFVQTNKNYQKINNSISNDSNNNVNINIYITLPIQNNFNSRTNNNDLGDSNTLRKNFKTKLSGKESFIQNVNTKKIKNQFQGNKGKIDELNNKNNFYINPLNNNCEKITSNPVRKISSSANCILKEKQNENGIDYLTKCFSSIYLDEDSKYNKAKEEEINKLPNNLSNLEQNFFTNTGEPQFFSNSRANVNKNVIFSNINPYKIDNSR